MTGADASHRPPRVIHIVESLDAGAVENWLLRMLKAGRTFDEPLDWTFYCVLTRPGRNDELARSLGATVLHSPVELDDKLRFMRHLRRALKAGRYEIMHNHHDVVSAVYLVAALGLPITRRIVHVHNADLHVPTGSPRKSAALREPMRRVCLRLADRVVGISRYTLSTFLRGEPPKSPRDLVLYYGIDTVPYHGSAPDPGSIRSALGLGERSNILLFVGRMVDYKNPLFVVDVLAAIAAAEPSVCAVFVGAGPLVEAVRARASELGISNRIRVLGWRDDTVQLMRASDLFVFPRVEEISADLGKEGLGLVVVEAQAAGLTSLLSRGIPDDAVVIPELCESLSLAAGSAAWGGAVRRILARPRPDRAASLAAIESSRFSLDAGFRNLMALHQL